MREIKFKAQRVDGKGWVEGYYVYRPDGKHLIYFKPFECYSQNIHYEVIPETVCQFTGLKDKNGNDIYKGDLFIFSNSIENEVIFYNGSFGYDSFRDNDFDEMNFVELSNYHFKYNDNLEGQRIEITGNIHDKE